jgi:hypothetical protein
MSIVTWLLAVCVPMRSAFGQEQAPAAANKEPRPLIRVEPPYPRGPLLRGEEAECVARFTVGRQGRPRKVDVGGCPEVFRVAVRNASYHWRFRPPAGNIVPEIVPFYATFRFRVSSTTSEGPAHGALSQVAEEEDEEGSAPALTEDAAIFEEPVPLRRAYPRPPQDVGQHEDATCDLVFELNSEGRPEEITVRRCPDAWQFPVIEAAEKWRFLPGRMGGGPVASSFHLSITFQ